MPTPIAPTLPDGWEDLLDDIQRRLEQAVADVTASADSLPTAPAETVAPRRSEELTVLAEKLRGLEERSTAAGAHLQQVEQALQAEETALQERLAAYESVRHRLAAWVYRAIG
jgi:hypothetical protein